MARTKEPVTQSAFGLGVLAARTTPASPGEPTQLDSKSD